MSNRWCACCGYRHPDTGAYICRACMTSPDRQSEMVVARKATADPIEQRAFLVEHFGWAGWAAKGAAIPVAAPSAVQTGIESDGRLAGAGLEPAPATTNGGKT